MSRALIETTNLVVNLTPRPIEPSWIIEGKFDWYYDFDETILILEGSIVLENDTMNPTRYSAGDVIFFKDGAHARWHVEGHVRKLAFCRTTQPMPLGLALRVFNKLKRILLPSGKRQTASLVGSG